jgi:hypothetical protein
MWILNAKHGVNKRLDNRHMQGNRHESAKYQGCLMTKCIKNKQNRKNATRRVK